MKQVFQDALRVDPSERDRFLDDACDGELELRLEVESLLISLNQAESFLEQPIVRGDEQERDKSELVWSLAAGQEISHYRVIEPVDSGGMGEVYSATDQKLNRKIALKVLRRDIADDPGRLKRFQREAQTVSSLNHPNILTVFDFDVADDIHFFATEFVEGETLRSRLERAGSLTVADAVDIGVQTAVGLAAAHAAGVIHRDLKPENLMIRSDGILKILDFGLAKFTEKQGPDVTSRPNLSLPGMIMGTARYMSPEQARGYSIDRRTDLFSLGIVLYEMLSGVSPFRAASSADTVAAIIQRDPQPLSELRSDIPHELDVITAKALAKDRSERYQTAAELISDLKTVLWRTDLESSFAEDNTRLFPAGDGEATRGPVARTTVLETVRSPRIALLAIVAFVVLVAAAALGYWYFGNYAGRRQIESIAVMPFVNQSGNADVDYLADGMAETLINSLSRVSGLSVKGRSSVFRYKDRDIDEKIVAGELGVQALLNGRVVQRGEDLTLFLSLDDAATGDRLWGKTYSRKFADLVTLQSEIARDVSQELKVRLSGDDRQRLAKNYTANPEAYRLYLQGRYFWNKRTEKDIKKSLEYFNQAIALDPDFALGYTGIADSYSALSFNTFTPIRPADLWPKVKEAALRALEIDSELAEAHTSLGFAKERWDWDFAGAEREYKRAIELNPDYPSVHHRYGVHLSAMGRFEESIAEFERARQLDPLSMVIACDSQAPYFASRRYDRSAEILEKALEIDPNFARAHLQLSSSYRALGRYEDAIAELEKAQDLGGAPRRPDGTRRLSLNLGLLYAATGRKVDFQKILAEMNEREARGEYVPPNGRAVYYAQLGDKDQAFFWLEKTMQERVSVMVELKSSPVWDKIRDDPRFTDILRRVGLPN